MTKVLYLSYDGLTDPLGQSQVIPYLQGLTQQGYSFTIISFEKPKQFQKGKDQIQSLLDDSGIYWVPLTYHRSPPVLATLYDVWRMRWKAYELQQTYNFRIVHCRSYIPALIGMAMKRRLGVKFVFDMRGFWADERVEGGLWNLKNPVYRFIFNYFKRRERELLSYADYTITLTHKAKQVIHQWKNIQRQPISIQVIPCCVDIELFDPAKINQSAQNALRNQLGIPDNAFVLSYLGSLGTWYMAEEMLNFFSVLQQSRPDAFFLFITQGLPKTIQQLGQQQGIDANKIVVASATRLEVPLYLSLSNWSVFFIKPVFSKQGSSATKMGEIMSMGIPLVTNRGIGDSDIIVQESGVGVLTDPRHNQAAIDAIAHGSAIPAKHIRTAAITHFSLLKGVTAYRKVYQQLMKNSEI